MQKPERPRKLLSTIAEYKSCNGAGPKEKNPNHVKQWKEFKKINAANFAKYRKDMAEYRRWEKAQKAERAGKQLIASKHPRSDIPAGVKEGDE